MSDTRREDLSHINYGVEKKKSLHVESARMPWVGHWTSLVFGFVHSAVLELFKDEVDLSQTEGTSEYDPPLEVGNVYVLPGILQNGKLEIDTGDFMFPLGIEWIKVSPTQREGLKIHYKKGCGCRIGPCYGRPDCLQNIPGCEDDLGKLPLTLGCRMKHQFCEMEEADQSCHWKSRPTSEFQDCDNGVSVWISRPVHVHNTYRVP